MKDLTAEWEEMAPHWIKEMREGRNATREIQLDPPMLELCGELEGMRAIDLGCGEGRFSRKLAKGGVEYVLGLDRSSKMIEAARELAGKHEEYKTANVEDLGFLDNESFDLAVSYLNQCDLADFMANTREVYRILKPGCRFVIANLHPMRSAVGMWCKTDGGEKKHVIVDDYFAENERHWTIMGVEITNFHRSLETYVNGFLECGFVLEQIVEPSVSPDVLGEWPELDDEVRVPNFVIFSLRK